MLLLAMGLGMGGGTASTGGLEGPWRITVVGVYLGGAVALSSWAQPTPAGVGVFAGGAGLLTVTDL